jgi:hypothetical protein
MISVVIFYANKLLYLMKSNMFIGVNNSRDNSRLSGNNISPSGNASRVSATQMKTRSKKESQISKDK